MMPDVLPTTLCRTLELDRLEHRVRRLDHVVRALRVRVADRERDGRVPAPLCHAIRDFQLERVAVQRELRSLRRDMQSA